MAHILAYTSPGRGHLYPLMAILVELKKAGHNITLLTLTSQVDLAQSYGLEAESIDRRIEEMPHDDYAASSARGGLQRSVVTFSQRAKYDAADLQKAIDATNPDAIIVDINCWGAVAIAEAWGGPWATFCPYPIALTSKDVPPFGPGFPPAQNILGRLRDKLLKPLFIKALENIMLPPINKIRSSLHLAPVTTADEMFTKPNLVLYLSAEPFEYPRSDWPSNIVMVGPCAWDPPVETPDWLAKIDRPIILLTTSSEFQDDGKLVEIALSAFANEDVHIVATLPSQNHTHFQKTSNSTLVPFVPHSLILERAVCAVTHGGMGATQKALAHGVPVCAVPFGRDQLEVARRVEIAKAGTRLPATKLNPKNLREKVYEAVNCVEGARRVASCFKSAGGGVAAARQIELRLLEH